MSNADRAALGAAQESASAQRDEREVTLSTGVVIRVGFVPREIWGSINTRLPEPQPPIWRDPERNRETPNANDPEYLEKRAEWSMQIRRAFEAALYVLAVQVVSVPDGLPGPNDAVWLERLRLSGMASGDSADAHRLDWLRLVGAPLVEDWAAVMKVAGRFVGVPEVDVAEATKSV